MRNEATPIGSVTTVPFSHPCDHPGCTKWGSFGKERHGETEWRCMEHLASDYWDGPTPARN